MSTYSWGPFSHVFFMLDCSFGWQTYTYRRHRESPAGSLVPVLISINNFETVYVNTELIRS